MIFILEEFVCVFSVADLGASLAIFIRPVTLEPASTIRTRPSLDLYPQYNLLAEPSPKYNQLETERRLG